MALQYPQTCYGGLLGINGACTVPTVTPKFQLSEIPSVTIDNLAKLSNLESPRGEDVGIELIESASRFVSADIVGLYDAAFKIVPSLVNGCSSCTFTANESTGSQLGTMVKNLNSSRMARLIIPSIRGKINATGEFTIEVTDGVTSKTITQDFVAGEEFEIPGVDFSTLKKEVRIFLQESAALPKLSCPAGSGCGCSGKVAHQSDLVFTGTSGGVETSQAYGFLPCAYIGCNSDDVLCTIANQAPVMVAQAMLYKVGELYHMRVRMSPRNNQIKNATPEDMYRDERYWGKLYENKIKGVGVRGIKDVVNDILRQTADPCILCDAKWQTAWATG